MLIVYFFSWDKISKITNNKIELILLKMNDKVVSYYKNRSEETTGINKFKASFDLVFVNAFVSSLGEIHYNVLIIIYYIII